MPTKHPGAQVDTLTRTALNQEIKTAPSSTSAAVKPTDLEPSLTPKQTAEILGVSESWLAKARMRGDGPAYTTTGRKVHYTPSDVVSYRKSRRRLSTSE